MHCTQRVEGTWGERSNGKVSRGHAAFKDPNDAVRLTVSGVFIVM